MRILWLFLYEVCILALVGVCQCNDRLVVYENTTEVYYVMHMPSVFAFATRLLQKYVLCFGNSMRIQSILYMRLYKLRKEHVMKNVKVGLFWFAIVRFKTLELRFILSRRRLPCLTFDKLVGGLGGLALFVRKINFRLSLFIISLRKLNFVFCSLHRPLQNILR